VKGSLASGGHILRDMPLLLTQRGNDSQQTLGKVTAGSTLGPKAAFAPEHDRTQGALCGIICRFYALPVHKGPQRRLVLEQRTTQGRALGVLA
jgi:hypothetical protein